MRPPGQIWWAKAMVFDVSDWSVRGASLLPDIQNLRARSAVVAWSRRFTTRRSTTASRPRVTTTLTKRFSTPWGYRNTQRDGAIETTGGEHKPVPIWRGADQCRPEGRLVDQVVDRGAFTGAHPLNLLIEV